MAQFVKLDDGTIINIHTIARIGQDNLVLLDGVELTLSPDEKKRVADSLLKPETLSSELSHLTSAVRDLWQLLRARMR